MISEIIQEIKAESSKNAKIAILTEHKDNELLQKALVACYDPYVQYYIRKIPDYAPGRTGGTMSLDAAIDALGALSRREHTGHAASNYLSKILENVSEDDAHIIERIIAKTMDCGMTESTVNKVWKKLIPTYPCLLANPYKEKTIAKIVFPAYSQMKADGMRANAHITDGKVHICGRSGKTVDLLGELDADLLDLAKHTDHPEKNFVFDGELVLVEDDGTIMPRKKGNGILNKAIKGKISHEEAAKVRIRIWDIVGAEAFKAELDPMPYSDRYKIISDACGQAQGRFDLIETEEVADLAAASAHFEDMLERGEEGTILKNLDHVWENKRSKGLVKMKAEEDCDLEVIGFNPGKGKFTGMVGSIICTSSDKKVEVSISGLSNALRKEITDNQNDWLGRIVEVKYNERISSRDRKDVDSLFLPRFVELREDKDVANSSDEIV